MKLEENKIKEQKNNTKWLLKKNWCCDILKRPESTYVNLLQPRPGSWDCDNHVKIKFEHINPTKKKIHHGDKFKINQLLKK